MPEIKPEYPKGHRRIEMSLVEMLTEGNRSWVDIMEISKALGVVRSHAKSMQKEQRMLCAGETTKLASEQDNPKIITQVKDRE